MFKLRVLTLAGCILVLGALCARAQDDDLKAVLRKAIAAHGGEKNLNRLKAAHSKFKGSMELNGNKYDTTGESYFQKPDKMKNALTLDINGMKIDVVSVFDGKQMWVSTLGKTMEIKDAKLLKEVREQLQAEGAGGLSDFLKAPYELSALGEVKVRGKDAIGIRVSKKGQRDISFFFDKKSHLMVKTEMRTLDGMTMQEITQERYITSFQDKDGLKMGKTVEIHKDGNLFMTLEITDVQVLEKLDDATFAKP